MHLRPVLAALVLTALPAAAGDPAPPAAASHPSGDWELTVESGYLWQVGGDATHDYEIAPTQLTLRTPAHWTWWEGDEGARLVVRARSSLLLESIVEGPEDYYVGLAAAPSIEYWFAGARSSLFFSLGGGAGWTNSTDRPGALGQDFTLNWFAQCGLRRSLGADASLLAGAYFLHHSNGGQTDPNPGIDALGFTVGVGWRF